ncbi:MAG: hypothetical protein HKO68_12245 [Desulfobacterales bacterium]|nr:hypothetical protein [Desulfobacterales bacterium]
MRKSNHTAICQIVLVIFFLFALAEAGFTYDTIKNIPVPDGYERIRFDKKSFSHYLQSLPLKESKNIYKWNGKKVLGVLYNIYAVVDKPLLFKSDLEQCADFCMRFWADFHKNQNKLDRLFLYDYSGKKKYYKGSNKTYKRFLRWQMAYSNSYSIKKGANKVQTNTLQPGDMFVQNKDGGIGHVSLVVDSAKNSIGKQIYLIGYGFMPAQEFHIEKAKRGYGSGGWFTKKGYEKYLSEFPFSPYGKPVMRRFE